MTRLDAWLDGQLRAIDETNLRRTLRIVDSPQEPSVRIGGRTIVNLSSNDYLGLAAAPEIREAALRAIDEFGAGAGASRLISGTLRPHAELEERLAAFKHTPAAIAFSSGYAAATGTIAAVEPDAIVLDKLCHACLVDGARLSGAALRVFPHNHLDRLESHLRWARGKFPQGRLLVLTESVFSMDGDCAPLCEIVELKDRFGAWLLVDEAHAIGVLGERGRGLAADLGIADRIEIQMGTLGKALGSSGGYICGSRALIDLLINRARSFIFSTAPVPAAVAAAAAALEQLDSGAAEPRRMRLWRHIEALAASLRLGGGRPPSAIVPIILGGEAAAVGAAARLYDAGFLVPAVRYPTVARGAARLRITLSAAHSDEEIRAAAAAIACTTEALGATNNAAPAGGADSDTDE